MFCLDRKGTFNVLKAFNISKESASIISKRIFETFATSSTTEEFVKKISKGVSLLDREAIFMGWMTYKIAFCWPEEKD